MTPYLSLVNRGRIIVQAAPQAYFDLDVEADGIAGFGSLLSVGAISPWGETFYAEIKPTRETFTPSARKFCEKYGLQRERLLQEGRDLSEVMASLAEWVTEITQRYGKTRAVLAAFNASYDFPQIDLAMAESGLTNPFGIAGFCVKSLALALSPGYDWRETGKGRMPSELIPPGDFTHNALEDAIYQQQLHFALVARLEELRG